MDEIRTLIVDDEPLARKGMRLRLRHHTDIKIVGEAGNGREALHAVAELRPRLMFLDVQMPGIDGFALLRTLPPTQLPLIVFVTAYDRYALDAFAACAVDYLLKPVNDVRLAEAIARARSRLAADHTRDEHERLLKLIAALPAVAKSEFDAFLAEERTEDRETLTIRDGQRLLRIDAASIHWIDAAGDYMCIHTGDGTHVLRGTMRQLEQRLDSHRFARVHRSVIVNLARVKQLRPHMNGEYFLTLDSGHELKLSRSYRDKLKLLI